MDELTGPTAVDVFADRELGRERDQKGRNDSPSIEIESTRDLVDLALDLPVEDQVDQQVLDLVGAHIQLLCTQRSGRSAMREEKGRQLLTLPSHLSSIRVYGLMRSIRYCVRSERRTSSM